MTARLEPRAWLLAALVLAGTLLDSCGHAPAVVADAPGGVEYACDEPSGAIPGSCGDRATQSSRRCVLCTRARSCADRFGEWCVGDRACADPACRVAP